MKLLIAGSREGMNEYRFREEMSSFVDMIGFPSEVVSGNQRGVDKLGEEWASYVGLPVTPFPYLKKYGRAGGPIRNRQMAEYADRAIIFIDNSLPCKGSKDMAKAMEEAKKPYHIVYF